MAWRLSVALSIRTLALTFNSTTTGFLTGNGGTMYSHPYAEGLGWPDYEGPAALEKAANPPYQAWTPQIPPPVQPGEGFSMTPGFPPADQPARLEMAFSALAEGDGYSNQLRITGIRFQ